MAILPILTIQKNNDFLRQKAKKVRQLSSIKEIIDNMVDTLHSDDTSRVGLAAPQIGIPLKISVIKLKSKKSKNGNERPKIPLTILINPETIKASKETIKCEEGCLSIPGIWGEVERSKSVVVKALNEQGKQVKIKTSGLFARVLQHEIDHLNGILFTDKADLKTLHKITLEGKKIKIGPLL
jgi:peptide deformylase